jgi:hypothetical protein
VPCAAARTAASLAGMSWDPVDSHEIPPPGGADATVWSWTLEKDGKRRIVQVSVSGTAMSSSSVPAVVEKARETRGATAVAAVLDWEEPPERIRFNTSSVKPIFEGGDPGPEVRELLEIVDWFQERGLYFIFAKRGGGTGPMPAVPRWCTHTAHLIDPKADELLGSFEAPTRLKAVRKARESWPGTEGRLQDAGPSPPAPSLKIDTAEADRVKRNGIDLIWNRPDEGDPDSGWLLEAYNDDGSFSISPSRMTRPTRY